jgi:hypothetical protein
VNELEQPQNPEKKPIEPEHIDKLTRDIYNQDFKSETSARAPLSKPDIPVESEWKHTDGTPDINIPEPKPVTISVFKRAFIVSAIFFAVSAIVALIVFRGGFNIISANKVEMDFVGPVAIAAGEELSFDIVIKNQNTTKLINTELYIDFPDGTKKSIDLTQDLNHLKEEVGTVEARASARRTIRSALFGKAQDTKSIKVTLQYGVQSSNGVFKKEKSYDLILSSSPLTLDIRKPAEVGSGENINLEVDVVSNSSVPLTNLLLAAEYPFGFQFQSSNPAPTADNAIWHIPVLNPGEKKTFIISGRTEGQENDQQYFKFNVGAQSQINLKSIATQYLSDAQPIRIRRPQIGVNILLNDSSSKEIAANPGSQVRSRIQIVNNMNTQLADAKIDIVFGGRAFDPVSPDVPGGLYRLPTQTVSWDRTSLPSLALLGPGERIDLSFTFSSLSPAVLAALKNGTITMDVKITGTAAATSEQINSLIPRVVKIQPTLALQSKILYSIGPFQNTGPVPPRSEQITTYTAVWSISRSTNDIADAEVRATLPSYVTWMGTTSPTTENITWIPERNEVIWRVGNIQAGSAGSLAREVAFQVSIKPGFSQIRSRPDLVQNIVLRAVDAFTRNPLTIGSPNLNTILYADPRYSAVDGSVQP